MRINSTALRIEDSLQLAAGSFNDHKKVKVGFQYWFVATSSVQGSDIPGCRSRYEKNEKGNLSENE